MTTRQSQVIHLIAEGYSSKEIASILHVSIETVRTHRKDLMKAYGAKNSAHLVRLWSQKSPDFSGLNLELMYSN